jgi:hypothetical protein
METILSIFIFALCINAASYIVGYGLDVDFVKTWVIDPESFVISGVSSTVETYTAGDPFTAAQFVFGNFAAGLLIFINIISGDYLSRMIALFGAGFGSSGAEMDILILPIRMITTFLTGIGVMYMVSGRGSKAEI